MCPVLDYLFLVFACMDCYMMCSFKWVAPLLTCRYMFGVSFMFFNLIFLFSFIWTGLCRDKAPTKLTENPLAAG